MADKTFDFYFDLVSPYAYLAATQLDALCARTGASARWRPILLGGVMQSTGNTPPLDLFIAPKKAWMMRDVSDWADYYGVPLRFPPYGIPFKTLRAQRALVAAGEHDKTRELARVLYEAIWVRGEVIEEPDTLAHYASSIGLDGAQLVARCDAPEVKQRLKESSDELVKLGGFGVPTFVHGERFYWGNDRLVLLEKALSSS